MTRPGGSPRRSTGTGTTRPPDTIRTPFPERWAREQIEELLRSLGAFGVR